MKDILIMNGKIVTVTKGTIENGYLLIKDGKISYVGSEKPEDSNATIVDAKDKWVLPGLIDCHSHLGVMGEPNTMPGLAADGNEMTDPLNPQLSAYYAIHPNSLGVKEVRNAGFTTLCVLPGSANIIGGRGVSIKLKGETRSEMVIEGSEQMKMALGENPKRCYGFLDKKTPMTRMATAAILDDILYKTYDYSQKLLNTDDEDKKMAMYDLKLQSLLKVIRRQQRVRIHCHKADDIETAIEILKKYNIDFVIEHATEGYMIADYLSKNNVTCVLGPLLLSPTKQEIWNIKLENAKILCNHGVNICLSADSSINTRWLPYEAGILLGYGMKFEEILNAVTINAAKVLQLDHRIGSLEVGKDADISLFNGNPFHNYVRCNMTIIDGEILFKES